MVLDAGKVLLPERADALSARLQAAARARGIRVYLVTVPTLDVPPSRKAERLRTLGHYYADDWLKEGAGVVLLVADDTADAIVVANDEADRWLPAWQRNMIVLDSMRWAREEKLLRDKIERAALVLVDVLSRAQDEMKKSARRDRIANYAMATIAVAGIAFLILSETAKAKR